MNENAPKRRRRWFRFSLRTLFVFMLLAGVMLGVLGRVYGAKRQRSVLAELMLEKHAGVYFHVERPRHFYEGKKDESWMPEKMKELFDTEYCRNVRAIDLCGSPIDDLTHLANFECLEELDLSYTKATDLSPLASMPNLEWINLTGTPVTDEEVNELQQASPN